MSILSKIKEVFFPTTIKEVAFPSSTQTAGTPTGGETKEVYTPTEVTPMSFPTLNIATGLKSTTFDTETRTINSNYTFQPLGAISIGDYATGNGIRISPAGIIGIHGGVTKFTLSSNGDFITSGFIQVGGAAADVNGAVTLISPGKILLSGSSVLSSWLSADATLIDGGKIYAGSQITAGTGNNVGILSGSDGTYRIWAGNATAGSAPFRVTQAGALTATSAYISGDIVLDNNGDMGTGTKLRWTGGTRIWSDSSNRMGINSIGTPMSIYVNSYEKIVIPSTGGHLGYGEGQITFRGGGYFGDSATTDSGHINANGTVRCNKLLLNQQYNEGDIDKVNIIKGYNDINFQLGDDSYWFSWYDTGWNEKMYLKSNGDWHCTGAKSSDVKTSDGKTISLYAVEAPEIWFMDFCENKNDVDPVFLDVTEGNMKFIKCDDNTYQVWRKRKDYAGKRLEVRNEIEMSEKSTRMKESFKETKIKP